MSCAACRMGCGIQASARGRMCQSASPSGRNASAFRHCPGPIVAARSSMLPAMEFWPLAMRDRCMSGRAAATICMHTTARAQGELRNVQTCAKGGWWLVQVAQSGVLHPRPADGAADI